MSTIARLTDTELDAGQALTETAALELFWSNPEALLDLIYGPSRRIEGVAPAHDHDEDGGEAHYQPILTRTWGTYYSGTERRLGIPLGPPPVGESYAPTTSNGSTDYSLAKPLDSCGIVLPGGCTSIRVDLVEYHEVASKDVTLYVCLRSLGGVNFKLGLGADDLLTALTWTTVGAATKGVQSAAISDLTTLGDTSRDRLVEISLWLASDLDTTTEHLLQEWSVLPVAWEAIREPHEGDLSVPSLAVKELKSGLGEISPVLLSKIKERYNALNLSLWGSTPGLNPKTLLPETRRRYQEEIAATHQHQGSVCYDGVSAYYGDGTCLSQTQSFGFTGYLWQALPLVSGTPPEMDTLGYHSKPRQGALLHSNGDTTANWAIFSFRRSIETGCGSLRIVLCAHPSHGATFSDSRPYERLLVSVEIKPVGGGSDIVRRVHCGPHMTITDSTDDYFGFCQVEHKDDPAYLPASSVRAAGRGQFSRDSQIPQTELESLGLMQFPCRISEEIRVDLTSIVDRPSDAYRATQDYNVRLRFVADVNGLVGSLDSEAGLLWLVCWTPPGW